MAAAPCLPVAEPSTFNFIKPRGGQIHVAERLGVGNISLAEMEAGLRMKSLTEAKIEGHLP